MGHMKSIKFSCPDDLRGRVAAKALRESRSESSVIREALYKYFGNGNPADRAPARARKGANK